MSSRKYIMLAAILTLAAGEAQATLDADETPITSYAARRAVTNAEIAEGKSPATCNVTFEALTVGETSSHRIRIYNHRGDISVITVPAVSNGNIPTVARTLGCRHPGCATVDYVGPSVSGTTTACPTLTAHSSGLGAVAEANAGGEGEGEGEGDGKGGGEEGGGEEEGGGK